ncbi:MAG: 4Fe-4S dicluster domain-containing protein [Lentisphaerae bacterium]|nr:4Fe-4S dicluster domain-containing protein [Lentisphaerota bacterium]
MKRKIIEIDQEKCTGCGKCIPNCPEGALQIIDGKARLISDLFCDGLGACIGECPAGAIRTVEREAEPYDEAKVMETIVKQGENTIIAHLKHLRSHGEFKLFDIAVNYLKEHHIPVPVLPHTGSPGSQMKRFAAQKVDREAIAGGASALCQWPVQLKLLNPGAEYFDNADLLVSADCVAHAYGSFHRELLNGRILIVFCPKLDTDTDGYVEKLAQILRRHEIRSVTVARMEVPCCCGTVMIVQKALELAGKAIPVKVRTVSIDGSLKD